MSAVKVELGRRLFYDQRLSVNGTTSCATCHIQALAFTDAKARSFGATGEIHERENVLGKARESYQLSLTQIREAIKLSPGEAHLEKQLAISIKRYALMMLRMGDHHGVVREMNALLQEQPHHQAASLSSARMRRTAASP